MTREQETVQLPTSRWCLSVILDEFPELCERFTPEEVYAMLAEGEIA